jgi:signal transduction histidine kinase
VVAKDSVIRVEIVDDGRGFVPSAVQSSAVRSGLATVKDRVMLAGGVLEVESAPSGGTRVTAQLHTGKSK